MTRSERVKKELEEMERKRLLEAENSELDKNESWERCNNPNNFSAGSNENETPKKESWEEREQRLRSQFWIGMPYSALVATLGLPTSITNGPEILQGGLVIGSPNAIERINQTQFLYWDREEARYFLTVQSGYLKSIDYINPPSAAIRALYQDVDKGKKEKKDFFSKLMDFFKYA